MRCAVWEWAGRFDMPRTHLLNAGEWYHAQESCPRDITDAIDSALRGADSSDTASRRKVSHCCALLCDTYYCALLCEI